jgi:hypothetical protein
MAATFWLLFLIFAVTVWPVWLIRRMRRVRAQMSAKTRDEHEPFKPGFTDEVRRVDGLVYAKSDEHNEELIAADKQSTAMPDIVKTLEGRR